MKYPELEELTNRFSAPSSHSNHSINPKTVYRPFNIELTLLTLPNQIGKVRLVGLSGRCRSTRILLKNIFLHKGPSTIRFDSVGAG